ncbi:hypothetical protein IFR05_005296 [Cadophora sp. M221]|nr:hypothetical protein IFR05_005296 [Cadophora sp. M221]
MQQLTLFTHGAALDDVPLTNVPDHCKEFASLQHVTISNQLLTTIDITKIYTIPNLSTLVVDEFRMPKDVAFVLLPDDYKPTKLVSIEFRRTNCLPIGLCVEFLLKNHPLLKILPWSIQHTGYRGDRFDSKAVSRSLSALHSYLTKLHISYDNSYYIANDCQLDFSDFIALQYLEIHERITLARNVPATRPQYSRQDLPGRLPASLQTLKLFSSSRCSGISFDPNSQALGEQLSGPVDYSWIVALARHPELVNTQLSIIDLTERACWVVERSLAWRGKPVKIPDLVEWVYPEEIIETFRRSGIKLRVMLKPLLE